MIYSIREVWPCRTNGFKSSCVKWIQMVQSQTHDDTRWDGKSWWKIFVWSAVILEIISSIDPFFEFNDFNACPVYISCASVFCASRRKKKRHPVKLIPSRSIDENDNDALIWVPWVKLIPVCQQEEKDGKGFVFQASFFEATSCYTSPGVCVFFNVEGMLKVTTNYWHHMTFGACQI